MRNTFQYGLVVSRNPEIAIRVDLDLLGGGRKEWLRLDISSPDCGKPQTITLTFSRKGNTWRVTKTQVSGGRPSEGGSDSSSAVPGQEVVEELAECLAQRITNNTRKNVDTRALIQGLLKERAKAVGCSDTLKIRCIESPAYYPLPRL